ncbi:YveK family protein [Aquibacillus albus]|uniref:Capsular polysaccharide biosynthesis protein n=1 Tax=Aquibacillus albus TaxID=1168171 RepID=A0ABS2N5U1_9BACI|nr:Wzz/FepE/Etk N-terminal domain-containing protein [Aquibacillus albus]MBM7573515.1 capsular polysaccharide biosynthesis protein [Aquibacillus albus]
MEETVSLREIFEVLKKRMLLILSLTIGAALISGFVSYYLLTPTYQSSSQFIVNQKENAPEQLMYDLGQIRTNVELINTYNVIIKSPRILDMVSEQLGTEITPGNIGVSSAQESQVVTVTARDTNPAQAITIANTIVTVFQEEIPTIMNVDNVNVLSEATVAGQVSPNPLLNIAIALVLGAMVGVGLAFLLEYLDNTIKSEDDIQKYLDIPVLGVVSHVDNKGVVLKEEFNYAQRKRGRGVISDAEKKTV